MYKYILFFIIFFTFLDSCSPVRTNNLSKKQPTSDNIVKNNTKNSQSYDNNEDNRFHDTTIIKLETTSGSSSNTYEKEFDDAVQIFESSHSDEACQKIQFFANSLVEGDSLYYEAKFYEAECLISQKKINEAGIVLEKILKDRLIPDIVLERVLVRLGHIYCLSSKKLQAEKLFQRLKNEFPESIYISAADCNKIKSK